MRITAFKIPKPRRFEYIPRYYDPQKEQREERTRRVLRELENESGQAAEGYRPMTSGDVKHYINFGRKLDRRGSRGGILIRIFTVILALTVALLVFYGAWVLVRLV
jgi:hypothetical protein